MKKRLKATDNPTPRKSDCIYQPMSPPNAKKPSIMKNSNLFGWEFIPKDQSIIIRNDTAMNVGMSMVLVYKKPIVTTIVD